MIVDFLVRRFVPDCDAIQNPKVRARYGALSGLVGICLNLCLFAFKFLAGAITASIAITADAFNNLSDAASSVVTLVGFRMAERPADDEHPFGHGRIEYICGLIVSAAIFVVGLELLKSSFEKVLHPGRHRPWTRSRSSSFCAPSRSSCGCASSTAASPGASAPPPWPPRPRTA